MVKARTCEGCKALRMSQGEPAVCLLNFKFDKNFRPETPCPKPLTNKEFVKLNKNKYSPFEDSPEYHESFGGK